MYLKFLKLCITSTALHWILLTEHESFSNWKFNCWLLVSSATLTRIPNSTLKPIRRELCWQVQWCEVAAYDMTQSLNYLSRDMTKPTKWVCAQQRLRSAWASAQSDQSSLSAWRKLGSLATHWEHRLLWVFAGRTLILLVLSCRGSFVCKYSLNTLPTLKCHGWVFYPETDSPWVRKACRTW